MIISKRGGAPRWPLSPSRARLPSGQHLVGKRIAVPYHFVIADDNSGCFADATVLAVSLRGCLVLLAGEQQWHSESFIRQWMVAEDQLICEFEAFDTSEADAALSSPDAMPSPPLTSSVLRTFRAIGA
jgi:hypothetical protein